MMRGNASQPRLYTSGHSLPDGLYEYQARDLLKTSQICGRYLGRLAGMEGSRVTSERFYSNRVYTIVSP